MLKTFLKEYAPIVAIIIFVVGYWLNSATTAGENNTHIAGLVTLAHANELSIDENKDDIKDLEANDGVQDQRIQVVEQIAERQTIALEKLTDTQRKIEVTLAGVEAELRASREQRAEDSSNEN